MKSKRRLSPQHSLRVQPLEGVQLTEPTVAVVVQVQLVQVLQQNRSGHISDYHNTYDVVVSQQTRNLGSLCSLSNTPSSIMLGSIVEGAISLLSSIISTSSEALFFLLPQAAMVVLDTQQTVAVVMVEVTSLVDTQNSFGFLPLKIFITKFAWFILAIRNVLESTH